MKILVKTWVALVSVLVIASCGGGSASSPATGNPPVQPQNLVATKGSGVQKNTLTWDPVAGATSYNLYWSNTGTASKTSGTLISNVTSTFTHAQLNAGTYSYVVTALNENGESGESTPASASVNLVSFVTSTTGNSNLSTWPDAISAGSVTGTAAGDAICQARAAAAGLVGTYKAWISSSADDAYCRVQNLSGKRSANCGQGSLPTAAGPWVRTDGLPFAPTIDKIGSYIYAPPAYDESGALFSDTEALALSGTDYIGTANIAGIWTACSDWTDGTNILAMTGGYVGMTTANWAYGFGFTCDTIHPLYCLQTGTGPALVFPQTAGKKVFVTSTIYDGNLGGLSGADAKCQARALAAGLANPTSFKAWISDSSTDAISRLTSNGPWVKIDGFKVADSKADLSDGAIFTSINQNESGNYMIYQVWTGTIGAGTKAGNTCGDWTDNSPGVQGSTGSMQGALKSGLWTASGDAACNTLGSLYCFED